MTYRLRLSTFLSAVTGAMCVLNVERATLKQNP